MSVIYAVRLERRILIFKRNKSVDTGGDGPASFNYEATKQGYSVTSFDPVYQFSKDDLQKSIEEVRITVMQQMRENIDNYFQKHYDIEIKETPYEFQKNANKLLIIRK